MPPLPHLFPIIVVALALPPSEPELALLTWATPVYRERFGALIAHNRAHCERTRETAKLNDPVYNR